MSTRAERTVRPASSVSRTAGERCEDILVLARVWVQAIPRLARAGWFMVGALTLIIIKGIRRALGQSGLMP